MNNDDDDDDDEHHDNKHEEYQNFWIEALEAYYGSLLAYARFLSNKVNVGEPEDWTNTCACRILSYAPDPATVGKPSSYFRRTMHNLWVDEIKKRRVGSVESMDTPNNKETLGKSLPSIAPEVEATFKKREFHESLEGLGPFTTAEKKLLAWTTKGFSVEEIAVFCDEDLKKTKKRWHALVNKLRYRWRVKLHD